MKYLQYIFLVFAATIMLYGCKLSEATDQTQHIPNDANFVLTLNTSTLFKKLESAHIDPAAIFGNNGQARQRWELAKQAVNLDKPIYIFTKSKTSVTRGKTSFTATVASLKDKEAAMAYLSKFQPDASIKHTKTFSFTTTAGSSIGWNHNSIIFLNPGADEQELATLFTMNKELSIGADDAFNKSLNPASDATFFMNTAAFLLTNPTLAVSKLSILLKDTYTSGTINFSKGSVDGEMQTVYGRELQKMIQNHPSPTSALQLIQKYPEQPGSLFALSLNPNLLKALAEYAGVKTLAEQYLGTLGITPDEALNALDGNFALASSNITPNIPLNKLLHADLKSLLSGNYILSAGIQNKAVLDKLVNVFGSMGMINNSGEFITIPFFGNAGTPGILKLNDKNLLYGSSADFINRFYQINTAYTPPQDVLSKLQNKVVAFYLDGQTIFQQLSAKNPADKTYSLSKNTFKDFYLYSNPFSGKDAKGAFSLRLMNNEQNSLVAVFNFINALSNMPLQENTVSVDTMQKVSDIPDEDIKADPDVLNGTKTPAPL